MLPLFPGLGLLVGALGQRHVLEGQFLAVTGLGRALPIPFPSSHVGEVLIVALGLTLCCLVFLAEVAAARLFPFEGVAGHQLGQLKEVGYPTGFFKGLGESVSAAQDSDVGVELVAQGRDFRQRLG